MTVTDFKPVVVNCFVGFLGVVGCMIVLFTLCMIVHASTVARASQRPSSPADDKRRKGTAPRTAARQVNNSGRQASRTNDSGRAWTTPDQFSRVDTVYVNGLRPRPYEGCDNGQSCECLRSTCSESAKVWIDHSAAELYESPGNSSVVSNGASERQGVISAVIVARDGSNDECPTGMPPCRRTTLPDAQLLPPLNVLSLTARREARSCSCRA